MFTEWSSTYMHTREFYIKFQGSYRISRMYIFFSKNLWWSWNLFFFFSGWKKVLCFALQKIKINLRKDQRVGKCKREREIQKKKSERRPLENCRKLHANIDFNCFQQERILISRIIFVSQFERLLWLLYSSAMLGLDGFKD